MKRGQVEPQRARRRPLPEHHVELALLHRWVEDLLDGPREPVDLVDEQDVALGEVRQGGREVAGASEHGPRRDPEPHAHLLGDDARERRLAQPRRAREQQVVRGLASSSRGLEDDREVPHQLGLSHELAQRPRPQPGLVCLLAHLRHRVDGPRVDGPRVDGPRVDGSRVDRHRARALHVHELLARRAHRRESTRSAWRSASSTLSVSSSCSTARRTSSEV